MAGDGDGIRDHCLRGLGISARNNALAYGFSISISAVFGTLQYLDRPATWGGSCCSSSALLCRFRS